MLKKLISQHQDAVAVISLYLQKYRRDFMVLGILSVVSAVTNSAVPFLAGRLIDSITNHEVLFSGTLIAVPLVAAIIVAWLLVKIIADVVDRRIAFSSDRLGTSIEGNYIVRGVGILLTLPLAFHKHQKIGEIFERINRASGLLGQMMSVILIDLSPQFLSIVIAFGITFAIKPILAAILAGAVCLYVFILVRVTPGISELQRKTWRAYSRAYGDVYDSISNVNTVKQAVAEEHEKRKHYRNFHLRAIRLWLKLNAIWQNLSFSQRLLVSSTQFAIFALSIVFIRSGTMTIGELVMFNGYAAMLFGPFVTLGRNWQSVQSGLTALDRAEQMLRTKPESYEPRNALFMSDIKGGIEFRGVSFKYQRRSGIVLEDVNFLVKPGTTVALVGESGVGKTTLIDLLSFYYPPTSGTIYIDGHNIATLNLRTLRSQIGVVPQEVVLFNDTVKNNIKYGKFDASDEGVKKAVRLAHADDFIESFPKKYDQVVGERGIKLSTGQKQRIAIARAILRDPRILILDEPTSALDAKSEKFITESLEQLMKGRTTFIIAHRLSTVRKANMILVLENGRIVERGKHEELVEIPHGVYRRLYELQIGLK